MTSRGVDPGIDPTSDTKSATTPSICKAGIAFAEFDRRPLHHALVDVVGDVDLQRAGAFHRVEEHACLRRRTGSEFDELDRTGSRHDVVGDRLEERVLGASLVVLGSLGDLLEQIRADIVVEVTRRDLGRGTEEPRAQLAGLVLVVLLLDTSLDPDAGCCVASENHGLSLRRSALECPTEGVASGAKNRRVGHSNN